MSADRMSAAFIVNIDVPDLDAAERFYCDGLRLARGRSFGGGMLELLGGPAAIYLLEKPAGSTAVSGSGARRDYARHWTPVHLDFIVPDIEGAVARAVAAGAVLEHAIRDAAWGRIAVFADPFGNGFCLIQFTVQGYDAIADAAG